MDWVGVGRYLDGQYGGECFGRGAGDEQRCQLTVRSSIMDWRDWQACTSGVFGLH